MWITISNSFPQQRDLYFPAGGFRSPYMATKNQLTISDVARMGARAQLKKYGRKQLREWGKLGGRPRKLRQTKKNSRVPAARGSRSGGEGFAE
jgi:hypothetical protein